MSEIFGEASAPRFGDRVQRPLPGVPYDRFGTVSTVEDGTRPKPWIEVVWDDGGTGWYGQAELVLVA